MNSRYGPRGGIILAGGNSSRFGGMDKSLARVGNGATFLEEVVGRITFLDQLIISTSGPERAARYREITGIPTVIDVHPGILGGILAGLKALGTGEVFLAAVDMPLLRRDVIERQFAALPEWDVVVPLHPNGFIEPLHVVLRRDPSIEALSVLCERGERKVSRLFDALRARYLPVAVFRDLDPFLSCFTNVNDRSALRTLQERH